MRLLLIGLSLITLFCTESLGAADQAEKQQAAESKAEVLEQNVVSEGTRSKPAPSQMITKPEVQAVDPSGEKALDDAITCLARTIYWEARGEDATGQEAIASVVMNRLGNEGFPDTVCAVVTQGKEQGACQFSWWCDGHSDDAQNAESYTTAKEISRKALNRQLGDRTKGALYFHQRNVTPDWSTKYIKTAEIGEHIFYKPKK